MRVKRITLFVLSLLAICPVWAQSDIKPEVFQRLCVQTVEKLANPNEVIRILAVNELVQDDSSYRCVIRASSMGSIPGGLPSNVKDVSYVVTVDTRTMTAKVVSPPLGGSELILLQKIPGDAKAGDKFLFVELGEQKCRFVGELVRDEGKPTGIWAIAIKHRACPDGSTGAVSLIAHFNALPRIAQGYPIGMTVLAKPSTALKS